MLSSGLRRWRCGACCRRALALAPCAPQPPGLDVRRRAPDGVNELQGPMGPGELHGPWLHAPPGLDMAAGRSLGTLPCFDVRRGFCKA